MSNWAVYGARAHWLANYSLGYYIPRLLGYTQTKKAQDSETAQIRYNDYLKAGFQRQYDDWQKNVGKYGRTIRYPEISYPGQMYRTDTATARAMYDYDIAGSNFYGRSLYSSAGLYGIGSRVTRWL